MVLYIFTEKLAFLPKRNIPIYIFTIRYLLTFFSCRQLFVYFFRLLHQAALWDNAELLEDLLNGDEIKCLNSRDSWGRTALHAAATNAGSRYVYIFFKSEVP